MPKFNADSIGGELEYDFSRWGGPQGVVPEPPRFAVNKMLKGVNAAFKDLGLIEEDNEDTITADGVADTMNKIEDEEIFEKLQDRLLEVIAEVCAGSPSREVLEKLPYRPFQGFFGYLVGSLTNPEASTPDTKNSRRLRSA